MAEPRRLEALLDAARDLPVTGQLKQDDSPESSCVYCGGGRFLRVDLSLDAPNFGKVVTCPACVDIPDTQGIPERLTDVTFSSFKLSLNPNMAAAKTQCEKVALGEACCAVLSGNIGTGKSHLAAAALLSSVHSKPGLSWAWPSLLTWLRQQMYDENGPRRTEAEVMGFYQASPALVAIDDIGTEKTMEWAAQALYTICNSRYEEKLPTMLTTNEPTAIDERIWSRFSDGVVICEGRDVRRQG